MTSLLAAAFGDGATAMFSLFAVGVVLTLIAGFYCLVTTKNLIRALIGLELLTKSVTLLIIVAGSACNRVALAQALAITLIVIEVAVIVPAVGIVLCIFKRTGDISSDSLRNVKG